MKIVADPIKHVIDHDGHKLFTFPSDTCLNIIWNDIWPNIIRYIPKLFAIGNDQIDYPGYSVISTNTLTNNKFKDIFVTYYEQNGGIYTLDNIRNKWLCGEKKIYIMENEYYFCNKKKFIGKEKLMKLSKNNGKGSHINNCILKNVSHMYISNPGQKRNIIRLFVLNDFVF